MGSDEVRPNYALSVQEPWATLIVRHDKRIENRTWTPPSKVHGEHFAVHASKSIDDHAMTPVHHPDDPDEWLVPMPIGKRIRDAAEQAGGADAFVETLCPGSILGVARLLGVVRDKLGHLDSYVSSSAADMYANIPDRAPMDLRGGVTHFEVAEEIGNGSGEWPWWNGRDQAWCLGDVRAVDGPIPAKGALRFWEMEEWDKDEVADRLEGGS